MLGGSKKGKEGGTLIPLSSQPQQFFTVEEGEAALKAAQEELDAERRAGEYKGASGGRESEDDAFFTKGKGGGKKKKSQGGKETAARRGGGDGGNEEGGDDSLMPLSKSQRRAAQRAAKVEREAKEAQEKLESMTDEEYRQLYEEVALKDDSDNVKQNHKNYSLLQHEFLLLSIERVSTLRPHNMLTGASSDDDVRNAWKPVAQLYNLLVSGEWDVKHGEQPYFEDFYGVGRYTPTAVQGVTGLHRTHQGLYTKWQSGAPRAPPINTGNHRRNPPRHNRQYAIWKEWARVKGE